MRIVKRITYYPQTVLRVLSAPGLLRELQRTQRDYVVIIGRGHSGTRAPAKILSEAGVFMGTPLNKSFDYAHRYYRLFLYKAARLSGRKVIYKGNYEWDFTKLMEDPIPRRMVYYLMLYLKDIIAAPHEMKGWKIPETTLIYPWLTRLIPGAKFIFWVRHPLDTILGPHITDRLGDWGVETDETEDAVEERAISWKYQWDIVTKVARPKNFLMIRFEDFLADQKRTLQEMEDFLGLPLKDISADKSRMNMFKKRNLSRETYPFLREVLTEYEK